MKKNTELKRIEKEMEAIDNAGIAGEKRNALTEKFNELKSIPFRSNKNKADFRSWVWYCENLITECWASK